MFLTTTNTHMVLTKTDTLLSTMADTYAPNHDEHTHGSNHDGHTSQHHNDYKLWEKKKTDCDVESKGQIYC